MTSSYSARLLIREQMAGAAEVASESIPFFTNSGQNLVLQFSRSIPDSANSAKDIQISLSQSLRSVQFFKQLLYVNMDNEVIATTPDEEFTLLMRNGRVSNNPLRDCYMVNMHPSQLMSRILC